MGSLFLSRQKFDDRQQLINDLHKAQKGNCFICEKAIDLVIQKNSIDIDHVIPLTDSGKDDPSNFALTHASCNRSKQATNLEVARILHGFTSLRESLEDENRSPNLADILKNAGGGGKLLPFKISGKALTYSLSETGDNTLVTVPVMEDALRRLCISSASTA